MPSIITILGASLIAYASSVTALVTDFNGTVHLNARAAYTLRDTYNSANFFSSFNFYTGSDPTHGFVSYQSQSAASSQGLINTNNGQVYLGVDHTSTTTTGRNSVRVTSNKGYTHGLFIADIAHM